MPKKLSLFQEVIKPLTTVNFLLKKINVTTQYHDCFRTDIPFSFQNHLCLWKLKNARKILFAIKENKMRIDNVTNRCVAYQFMMGTYRIFASVSWSFNRTTFLFRFRHFNKKLRGFERVEHLTAKNIKRHNCNSQINWDIKYCQATTQQSRFNGKREKRAKCFDKGGAANRRCHIAGKCNTLHAFSRPSAPIDCQWGTPHFSPKH